MAEAPELPLSAFSNKTYFKVYLSDIGLLRVTSGMPAHAILEETGAYGQYRGVLAENYVLNELIALQIEPFFWRSGNTAELDFLFQDNGEVVPLEVKSADNVQAKSYRLFCKKYHPANGFKLSFKNIAENMCGQTRTVNLPLYLTWNLNWYLCKH